MKKRPLRIVLFIVSCSIVACQNAVPEHSESAIEKLGHYLFFEKKLSYNNTKSCANCHSPQYAFTDAYRTSIAADGQMLLHNAPSLVNLSQRSYYDWSNPAVRSLAQQIKRPLYHDTPREMGFNENTIELQSFFHHNSLYLSLFSQAFPTEKEIFTAKQIETAIIAFIQTIESRNSRFDQYYCGNHSALTKTEVAGFQLFSSNRLQCITCHPPPEFTVNNAAAKSQEVYVNTGLCSELSDSLRESDWGLFAYTHNTSDRGRFIIPSLRNICITAPYMHDGSVSSLEEVIDIYARGGRNINYGLFQGDGAKNRRKHPLIKGFSLSAEEKNNLLSFLASLTDTASFNTPRFSDPFRQK